MILQRKGPGNSIPAGRSAIRFGFVALFLYAIISPAGTASTSSDNTLRIHSKNGRNYISLHDIIHRLDIDNSFDVITQRGKLYRKTSIMVFQPGFSVALVNGRLLSSTSPVVREKGEIFFPAEMAKAALISLFPEKTFTITADELSIRDEAEPKVIGRETIPTHVTGKDTIRFIILDAGHGGKDPGAIGNGIREKDITLSVTRMVLRELQAKLNNVDIRLTRTGDRFIELASRTDFANRRLKKGANGIFVSIHVNASLSPKISGFETYYLSPNPSNEEARATATLENNVIVMENHGAKKKYDDVEYLEALMLNSQIHRESSMLASSIQERLDSDITEFKSRGVKKADFFVLRGSLMPAALVEIGYISNTAEARHLKRRSYQEKIARGISRGITDFIKKYDDMLKN
jgi:N-acetylmuramoyl-L-alanine amidase